MQSSDFLIRKTYKGILIVNIISMMSGIVCVMIDQIITGQFLGTDAVTAAGLIQPMTMICNLIGILFGPGMAVMCTRYMGMMKTERVKQVFSIIMITVVIINSVLAISLAVFAPQLAHLLGNGTGKADIVLMIQHYLRGFSIGMVPMVCNGALNGLMMMDNDQRRSLISMGSVFVSDIIFDLSNVLVFHGGMYGMAVATSMSNILGVCIVLTHFLRKERVLHLTFKGLRLGDIKDVVVCGVTSALTMGGAAVRGFSFNALMLAISSAATVASLSIATSVFSIIISLSMGLFVTTATICSLLYGEEDRHGLENAVDVAIKTVLKIFVVATVLLMVLAKPAAMLFVGTSEVEVVNQAAIFIRCMAAEFMIMCISYPLSGSCQGIGRLSATYLFEFLRESVVPISCVAIFGRMFGLKGAELGFPIAGTIMLVITLLIVSIGSGKFPKSFKEMLLVRDDFGAEPEELYEASIHNMDEVIAASQEVQRFCQSRGADARTSMMLPLFIEEMASNTVSYGFDGKKDARGAIDLRLIYTDEKKVIRLRDNGVPFDPVAWLKRNESDDPMSGVGIRIIMGLAKDVQYVPAMGLNNMVIYL